MARALGAHDGQRGLGHPEGAKQVGLDLSPSFGLADLLDRAEETVARVVDYHVEAAEARVRLANRRGDRSLFEDAQRNRRDLIGVALAQRGESLYVPCCGGDSIAARQCRLRPDTTEAFRRARDEPNLACHVDCLLRRRRDITEATSVLDSQCNGYFATVG